MSGRNSHPPIRFIPATCQRDYHVPTANAENQLIQAKGVTQQLIQSSKQLIFSFITREADRECRPSPLIKPYINNRSEDYYSNYTNFKKTILSSSRLDSFIDTQAPPIPKGEIAQGGSALFKDQAACPFRAFARHRLNAQPLQQVDIGLNAMERGNLAHRSLQFLWQRLKDYKTLDYKSVAELKNMIESVVNEAIKYQVAQQPETFTDRFTDLERQRLQQLLIDWLTIERDRNDFKVIATEQWQTLLFQDIEIHFRVDRIDELADGRHIIIDYKTGTVSKNDWQTDRPNDPQLPLYAITRDHKVAAIAYGSLKRGKLGFVGLAEDEDILPKVKPDKDIPWQDQLENWREILIQLANDFRNGEASVEPTTTACRYCDLHALCRIYERIETFDELEAEEGMFND